MERLFPGHSLQIYTLKVGEVHLVPLDEFEDLTNFAQAHEKLTIDWAKGESVRRYEATLKEESNCLILRRLT